MNEKIVYGTFNTPVGEMLAAASPGGLCRLCLPGEDRAGFFDWIHKNCRRAVVEEGNNDVIKAVKGQLDEYFKGARRAFAVELDLKGTVFQRSVWHILLQIPYGSTASYKDVAAALGNPAAVRAVGQANNRNPIPIIIPCHRVVGSNKKLVGYGGGLDTKISLLRLEGIKVGEESII
jgi:O-6-methylguanine DNA methyltransferase